MSNVISKIIKYISQHNEIFDEFPLNEKEEKHIFLLDDIILNYIKKSKILEITFYASMRPDIASNYTLIYQKTPGVKKIQIMEPYCFDEKKEMIYGDAALAKLKQISEQKMVNKILKEYEEVNILLSNRPCCRC